jgi:predicted ATPase/DNA-binding SARP family transcriptional activator
MPRRGSGPVPFRRQRRAIDVREAMAPVEFHVLGPLEVIVDGAAVPLGGPRQRAVLARLVLSAGRPVATEILVDAVWGERPPRTAVKTVQKYVSYLRRRIGPVLRTRPEGYQLDAPAADATDLESLVASAATAAGPGAAAELLTRALRRWRDEPYPELPDLPAAQAERRRLGELRLGATESLVARRVELGQHDAVVPAIEELLVDHPTRERLWAALMTALYRGGRQADALAAYHRLRTGLVAELGVEPSPELQRLYTRILRHEEPAPPGPGPAPPAAGPPGNLPPRLTSFVGRRAELRALAGTLVDHRLVTLTGPAGSGKTRLAVELAGRLTRPDGSGATGGWPSDAMPSDAMPSSAGPSGAGPSGAGSDRAWPDGAWLVELAPLASGDQVPAATAAALRLGDQPGRSTADVVADHLRGRRALLLLDNCEHVLDGAAEFVARVLRDAPGVRVLATSRQPVGVAGEATFPLDPLPVPPSDDVADLASYDAVRLLVDRARQADPRFELTAADAAAVAQVCRRLDGMPLALELAAARLRAVAPRQLADLLADRFRVLVSGPRTAPARHQTLLAAIAWSYDLLSESERTLFRQLSIFDGSFTVAAVRRVCGPALAGTDIEAPLFALVDQSLVTVRREPGREARYSLLETLREYGRAQLDPDEARDAHARHATWFLALAEAAAAGLRGPDDHEWLDRLGMERDNLTAALRWSMRHGERLTGLRLAAALATYWDERAHFTEGAAWLRDALDGSDGLPADVRAMALAGSARMALNQGRHDDAVALASDSLAAAGAGGDHAGAVRARSLLGLAALYQGRYADARPLLERCRREFAGLGAAWDEAWMLGRLGQMWRLRGDYERSRGCLTESLALHRRIGDHIGLSWTTWQRGVLARYEGDYDRAEALSAESLAGFTRLGDASGVAHARYTLADVARLRGDDGTATVLYEQSLQALREQDDRRCVASTLFNLAMVALRGAEPGAATGRLSESLRIRREVGDRPGIAECVEAYAVIAQAAGDPDRAVTLLAAAEGVRRATGSTRAAADGADHEARLAGLRAVLDRPTFDRAWARGSATELDELVGALVDERV